MITIVDLIRRDGREPGGGRAKVNLSCIPLMQFVYPTIPGRYEKRYKFVRHCEGIDMTKKPPIWYRLPDFSNTPVKGKIKVTA